VGLSGEGLDVGLDVEGRLVMVRLVGSATKGLEVRIPEQPEMVLVLLAADHHVVGLVLGVRPAGDLAHAVRTRAAVYGQVAAAHCVEVIEPHWEGSAEDLVHAGTKQFTRGQRNQHLEGHLDGRVRVTEQHTA
jgi:hypothetical protein